MPNKHANTVDIFKYIILEKKMQSWKKEEKHPNHIIW